MESVRINVSLPKNLLEELGREAPGRQRSRFICEAILALIRERKAARLACDYSEAAKEIQRLNREMEGSISDGLD